MESVTRVAARVPLCQRVTRNRHPGRRPHPPVTEARVSIRNMLAIITPATTGFGGQALSFGQQLQVFIAWLLSSNRKAINWRPVVWGVVLQIVLAVVLLAPALQDFVFAGIDGGVRSCWLAEAGRLVFQSVDTGCTGPAGEPQFYVGTGNGISPPAKTFAFWILPTIVFSSLTSVLYRWGSSSGS